PFNAYFFGGFADVTNLVKSKAGGPNGDYSFSGLTVANTGVYQSSQLTLASWAMVVVYAHREERYRYSRVYDGLQHFRGSSITTTQTGFRVPDLRDGKVTTITWEGDGDPSTSVSLEGRTESLSFDGYPLLNAGCDQV